MKPTGSAFARFAQQQRRWVLLSFLGLLHLLVLQGIESGVGRTLLAVHIGLFILWQPFIRAELRLSGLQLAAILAGVAAALYWASGWLLILWIMALAGMIGGKVFFFSERGAKVFYLLVLGYLIGLLLFVMVPQVLPSPLVRSVEYLLLAKYVLPALFPVMLLLPAEREAESGAEVIDFVYSAFIFLLLAVLVLGGLASMLLLKRSYFESLVVTIIVLSTVLLVMAWAWNPRMRFAGLNVFFSRYLLSVGLPFEQWLHNLADNLQREDEPEKFLAASLEDMILLPWVNGCEWQVPGGRGSNGRPEGQRSEFQRGQLRLAIFTQQSLSPALIWHFDLLAQLLAEFYEAKLRAAELQQISYVKAIHQTGARLTHDVKNLLQSLNALCLAATSEGESPSPEYQALLRRQLPVIAQRLQQTMDKLRRPELEGAQHLAAGRWWEALQSRYAREGISFIPARLDSEQPLPATLFNSAAENLLENALAKKKDAPKLQITVGLGLDPQPTLTVCDDGAAIPAEVRETLLREPVASSAGLGIGLYQTARHAQFYGYELRVMCNEPGRVCFELGRPAEADSATVG